MKYAELIEATAELQTYLGVSKLLGIQTSSPSLSARSTKVLRLQLQPEDVEEARGPCSICFRASVQGRLPKITDAWDFDLLPVS